MDIERCRKYKFITFDTGILDSIIDAVYVITLENSPRKKNVISQINKLISASLFKI